GARHGAWRRADRDRRQPAGAGQRAGDGVQGLPRRHHHRRGDHQHAARPQGTLMTSAPAAAAASAAARYRTQSPWTRLRLHPAGPVALMFFGLLAACIVAGLLVPDQFVFLGAGNLKLLLRAVPNYGLVAVGVGLLMIAGEFDLSVGAVYVVAPFAMAFAVVQ